MRYTRFAKASPQPSAPDSNRLGGSMHKCIQTVACGLVGMMPHHRRWGISPRPEAIIIIRLYIPFGKRYL